MSSISPKVRGSGLVTSTSVLHLRCGNVKNDDFTSDGAVCKCDRHGRHRARHNATWPPPGHNFRRGSSTGSPAKRVVSELRAANKAAGWSSESLMFTADRRRYHRRLRHPHSTRGRRHLSALRPRHADADAGTAARTRDPHTVAHPLRARPRVDRLEIPCDAADCRPHAVGHHVRDARLVARCGSRCAAARARLVSRDARPAAPGSRQRGVMAANGPRASASSPS